VPPHRKVKVIERKAPYRGKGQRRGITEITVPTNLLMKSIAILCNYRLEPTRVGGMDYFFWEFDAACKAQQIIPTWFFPNSAIHGRYNELNIIAANDHTIETSFMQYLKTNKQQFDTIICHFLELCTRFYQDVKNRTGAKIIAIDHNPRPIEGYPLKKRIRKRLNGLQFGKYIDVFVGVSKYTRNELIRDFGKIIADKIQVVYNGIDTSKIKVRTLRNKIHPTFLVACHLRESKGVQDLIEAVRLLSEATKSKFHIDVYGDGPYRKNLETMVSTYQLNNQFEFKGSSDRLFEIYHLYDYLIHPSHMECFSLGLLESLSANVPVITTNVGGNEEAVKQGVNGYIFSAHDSISLSEVLVKIHTGAIAIESNTSEDIRNSFTITKMVKQHISLI
jgi:glycosyltransferase involved in cell wall biosynthesis